MYCLRDRLDRDVVDIEFVFPNEKQQQIQRTFEDLKFDAIIGIGNHDERSVGCLTTAQGEIQSEDLVPANAQMRQRTTSPGQRLTCVSANWPVRVQSRQIIISSSGIPCFHAIRGRFPPVFPAAVEFGADRRARNSRDRSATCGGARRRRIRPCRGLTEGLIVRAPRFVVEKPFAKGAAFEFSVLSEKCRDDGFVFLCAERARRIDQSSTATNAARKLRQQFFLQCRVLRDDGRSGGPFQMGCAPPSSGTTARRIHEHAIIVCRGRSCAWCGCSGSARA